MTIHYTKKALNIQRGVDELVGLLKHYITDEAHLTKAIKLLGYAINDTLTSVPSGRAVQHTVRKNIVDVAIGKYCDISMHSGLADDGYKYHYIDIEPKEITNETEDPDDEDSDDEITA